MFAVSLGVEGFNGGTDVERYGGGEGVAGDTVADAGRSGARGVVRWWLNAPPLTLPTGAGGRKGVS